MARLGACRPMSRLLMSIGTESCAWISCFVWIGQMHYIAIFFKPLGCSKQGHMQGGELLVAEVPPHDIGLKKMM